MNKLLTSRQNVVYFVVALVQSIQILLRPIPSERHGPRQTAVRFQLQNITTKKNNSMSAWRET